MSMLFRSTWAGVLRAFTPRYASLQSRSMTTGASVTEYRHARSPDALTARIQSAPSSSEVLAAVQAHLPTLTHRHLLLAFRSLFELQKGRGNTQDLETLTKDPAFGVLCQNFKKHARSLDVNEAIEATKILSYFGISVNSLIVQTMLQMIRSQINLVNIRQIMFLDFVLSRFDTRNHLVEALKLALPLAFQIHLPLELDSQDLPLLREMLSYASSHDLPDRCINNVVTALLLHDQTIDAQTAKSIIWSLSLVNCTQEIYTTRAQLLHICCDILTDNLDRLSYDDVLRTVAKIKGRVLDKHPEYYHELLMDAIANYVVKNKVEFEKALLVARVLSRIAHTHLGLVEYLCEQAASDPAALSNARTNILFGFINCLSNNNYMPDPVTWIQLRKQISSNPILNGKNAALPWTKTCLELASLGHYEEKLISRVFSKEFLDEFLARENNNLDYLQLLTLHEAVNTFYSTEYRLPEEVLQKAREVYPVHGLTDQLEEYLARGLGGPEFVARNVVLPSGIVADLFLCMKGGHPVPMPRSNKDGKTPIEQLSLPSGTIGICVMNFSQGCFSMNSNRLRGTFRLVLDILEKQGFAAVSVNVHEWMRLPSHERSPYLMREVGYKCGEIGMKLSAT